MFEEGTNFLACERPREPLHVVLHEHLDRGALDRTTALDRGVHAAANRHVCAEKRFVCHCGIVAAVYDGRIIGFGARRAPLQIKLSSTNSTAACRASTSNRGHAIC